MTIFAAHRTRALCFLVFTLSLGSGCGSSNSDGKKGGVVGFSTGEAKPGALPTGAPSASAPTIVSAVAANPTVKPGDPLTITIAFSDPQADVARVNFGISGETGHFELAVPAGASGVTLELFPKNPVPGVYVLVVSLTDTAGNTSAAATIPFTILNPNGTLPSVADASVPSAGLDAAVRADAPAGSDGGARDQRLPDLALAVDFPAIASDAAIVAADGPVLLVDGPGVAADGPKVAGDGPGLSSLNAKVGPGGNVSVTFSAGPSNPQAWIAVYPAGANDMDYLGAYQYTAGAPSGTFTFPTPEALGTYEFRLFGDNGYSKVATSPAFTVTMPYDLDPTFGTGGKVTFDFLGKAQLDWICGVFAVAGNKVLLVGTAKTGLKDANGWEQNEFALAQLNADGTFDSTFGTAGKSHVGLASRSLISCNATTLQKDGKILVGGHGWGTTGGTDYILARFAATGALDTTFGTAGFAITNFQMTPDDPGQNDKLLALAAADDGTIVAAGELMLTGPYSNGRASFARYLANGTLDATFGVSGTAAIDFAAAAPGGQTVFDVNSLVLAADGSILAGFTAVSTFGRNDMGIARLKANGMLDTTFATAGVIWESKPGTANDQYLQRIEKNVDGSLLMLGTNLWGWYLSRYSATGVTDATFGTAGQVVADFSSSWDLPAGLLHPADGTLLVPFSANAAEAVSVSGHFALARHASTTGKVDDAFGKPVWKWTQGTTVQGSRVAAAAILDSGALILGGFVEVTSGGDRDFAVIKLLKNPGF
jgi:uncharacterized delta-60 repeat protein